MSTKTYILTGISLFTVMGAGLVIGNSTLQANAEAGILRNEDVQAALESGDIEAFRTAVNENGGDRAQRLLDNLDEEKFNELQEKYQLKEAVGDAIENSDYAAFQVAIEGQELNGRLANVVTEEDFNNLVAARETKQEFQARLTEAAQNQDRNAFEAVLVEMKEYREANKPEASSNNRELTDEKVDALYEKALEQVAEGKEVRLGGRKGGRGSRGNR